MNRIIEWLIGTKLQGLGGQSSWGFRFTSGFNQYLTLLLVLALVALVYLTIRSYRREGDASRRIKTLLASIRIAVILILVAVLFRPAIVVRVVRTIYSPLLVLLDNSKSMSFQDPYAADPAEQKELSRYLRTEPDKLRQFSREDLVRQPQGLAKTLGDLAKTHPIYLIRFSTTRPAEEPNTTRLETIDVTDKSAQEQQAAGDQILAAMKRLQADGYETDLAEAIRTSTDMWSSIQMTQGQRLAGLLVVSDFQPTNEDAERNLRSAQAAAARQGLVMTMLTGDPTPPKNVTVISLGANREIRKSATAAATFTVTLSQRNMDGQTIQLNLERRRIDADKWQDTGVTKDVTLEPASGPNGRGMQTVELRVEGDQLVDAGDEQSKTGVEYVFKVTAKPRAEEQNVEDNSAEAKVRIIDAKINVLLISADGGWEFQTLRNMIQRQPDQYRLSVWQQDAEPEVSQAASSVEMKLQKMPRTFVDLFGDPKQKDKPGYQVVVLYDPEYTKEGFDEEFVKVLKEYVNRGGGLCYIAGNKHTDENLCSKNPLKDLADVLPVTVQLASPTDLQRISDVTPSAKRVRLNVYGMDHSITRLGANAQLNNKIWGVLPGIYWSHPVYSLKPGARSLLDHPENLTAQGKPEPLLALHTYGNGPVAYLGTDETWRWQAVGANEYRKQFWRQLVEFLSSARPQRVTIAAGGENFDAGEKINVNVQAYDDKYKPWSENTLKLVVHNVKDDKGNDMEVVLKHELAADGSATGRYHGSFDATRTGTFELSVPAISGGGDPKRITIQLPKSEMQRVEANKEYAASLASGPKYNLKPYEASKLLDLVPTKNDMTVRETPHEIWDKNWLLVALVVLLAIEWIFRKKFNMA